MSFSIKKHSLIFKKPAGTSRGVLLEKPSWFLNLETDGGCGRSEVSVIPGLSIDPIDDIEPLLNKLSRFDPTLLKTELAQLQNFPAVRFAIEMLLLDMDSGGKLALFDNPFLKGQGIPINGLVWMGPFDFMYKQVKQKINDGYKCIKIKIAAIDWAEELELLQYIRQNFPVSDIQIRVDANGGFKFEEAQDKLSQLAALDVHSIEQPIKQGQWDKMAELCASSPLDIALDEELIGVSDIETKKKLLDTINPKYVILKPSLLGGFAESEAWIALAREKDIDYWVTSALESNLGLNAIAQWTAGLDNKHYQGLGTGQLYTNNIPSPLYIENGFIYNGENSWDFSILDN